MDEYKDYFVHGNKEKGIKGCVANGIPEEKATELWDIMALAASYSFNKSHAVAYSMHSIRTAWLSYYYPFEYMTALLNSIDDTDKLAKYLAVAKENNMTVHAPSVNKSYEKFTTDGKSIQIGISGIKGINAVAKNIIEEREKGLFVSLKDLLDRMSYYKNFSKKTVEVLIYSGMIDEFGGTRKSKLKQLDKIASYVKALKEYRKKLTDGKNHRKLVEPVLQLEDSGEELDMFDLIMNEEKYTGIYISGNPMDLFKEFVGAATDCEHAKNGNAIVCGVVKETERKISKKGNVFYTFKLKNNGTISGMIFSKNGEKISDNDVVKLEGTIESNEFGKNIKVTKKEDLTELRKICLGYQNIKIVLPTEKAMKEFKKIKFAPGNRSIVAIYNEIPREFKNIEITPSIAVLLVSLVGYQNIQIR